MSSLPDKLYVWDLAAKPGRPAREHVIPQANDVDLIVRCAHAEPGEVPIKIAKFFNTSGFRFTLDKAGNKSFEFPVRSTEKDASGGIRLAPGQTIANYDELIDSAVEDRCKQAGIDTDGMKKSDKIAALLKADGVSATAGDDDDEDLDLELEDDEDSDGDSDADIVNGAAGE